MSILIDKLLKEIKDSPINTCIDNMWVIARPYHKERFLKNRIKNAIMVLFDKAEAITYYKQ
jgi:hypothetical protein